MQATDGIAPEKVKVSWIKAHLPEVATVAMGAVVSVIIYSLSYAHFETDHYHKEFKEQSARHALMISAEIKRNLDVVRSISGLYAVSRDFDRQEFAAFVGYNLSVHPGIQALEWIPRVLASERAAYEKRGRQDGFSDFRITERDDDGNIIEAGDRDEYFPVYYVEPLAGNEKALGFDLASNETRLAALEQARDSGKLIATGRITLVQEDGDQNGFLAFMPVYSGGVVPDSIRERREKLVGFGLGVYRIGDLVDSTDYHQTEGNAFGFQLFDRDAKPGESPLHIRKALSNSKDDRGSSASPLSVPSAEEEEFTLDSTHTMLLDIAGRTWSMVLTPGPHGYELAFNSESIILTFISLLITAIFTQHLISTRNRTAVIESLVEKRSHELIDANDALQQEIEERKRVQTQLSQNQKMEAIGQLTGGIAHDFNNLLMVIDGYCRRAMVKIDCSKDVAECLSHVQVATDKATGLTRQLLSFSRRKIMEKRVFRVSDALREVEGLLQSTVGELYNLSFRIEDEEACIETDPDEFSQAILNLAINARDAMIQGGAIVIGARIVERDDVIAEDRQRLTAARYVETYVKDYGCGIHPDILDRIFEPFFTTKEQGKGTGLGLSMVYGFTEQSGGVVGITSRPGQGATVRIYFPLATAQPRPSIAECPESLRGQGETILLVEDDEQLLSLTCSLLEDLGYNVLTAINGIDALEVEDDYEDTIHLLLSDVVMPALGGFDLAQIMRERRSEMKALFMSGYAKSSHANESNLPRTSQFLQKPFKANVLAQHIRNELDSDNMRLVS